MAGCVLTDPQIGQLVLAVVGVLGAAAAYLKAKAAHKTANRAESKADSVNGIDTESEVKSGD